MVVMIPSGSQVEIPGVDTAGAMEYAIKDLRRYGAREANELRGKRLESFPGMIYSQDKPVSVENIQVGAELVEDAQDRRAADEAVKSAKAADVVMRDPKTRRRMSKTTEVSVQQDVPRGVKPSGKEVAMQVTVAEDGKPE